MSPGTIQAEILGYQIEGAVEEIIDPDHEFSRINVGDRVMAFFGYDDNVQDAFSGTTPGLADFIHDVPFNGLQFIVGEVEFHPTFRRSRFNIGRFFSGAFSVACDWVYVLPGFVCGALVIQVDPP